MKIMYIIRAWFGLFLLSIFVFIAGWACGQSVVINTTEQEKISGESKDGAANEPDHSQKNEPEPSIEKELLEKPTEKPPCGCVENATRTCYTGPPDTLETGLCKAGLQTCRACVWEICIGEVKPATEICDGLDNNCDGQIDEICECITGQIKPCYLSSLGCKKVGEAYQCAGICKAGKRECVGGRWDVCVGQALPQAEICDGLDNDCDGQIDNGVCTCKAGETRACYNGPPGTIGKGICKPGTQSCQAGGTWGTCVGAIGPQPTEICGNNLDDNCDGFIDEGCSLCPPGQTRPCGSSVGLCKQGSQTCLAQGWGPCEGEIGPTSERCDGKDNNCNGQIDEGLSSTSGGPCVISGRVGACAMGQLTCNGGVARCIGPNPTVEVCDNLDNDCNGQIDEGNVCVLPGAGKIFRANTFAIAPATVGFDIDRDGKIDNKLAILGSFVNSSLTQAVASNSLNLLIEIAKTVDPNGVNGAATVYLYMGRTATGGFLIERSSLDAQSKPLFRFAGSFATSIFNAGPSIATLALPLFGTVPFSFTLQQAYIRFAHTSFLQLRDGLLGGVVPAAHLDKIPADQIPLVGGPGKTLLDVLVGLGIQPDIDLDGDGLERFVAGTSGITACFDGNQSQIPGGTCAQDPRIADGYSVAFQFTALPTKVLGITP